RYLGEVLPSSSVAIILFSIVLILLMGRLVSYVNLNFVATGYWEKRFPSFIFLFACLLAPIPLIKFMEKIHLDAKIKRRSLLVTIFPLVIISFIILSGFSSMVLQSEYWFTYASNNPNSISQDEWQGIDYLRNILQHDTHAFVIAPTLLSREVLV